jgi:hypothetical protein
VNGSVNDLRLSFFRVAVKNNTKEWLPIKDAYIVYPVTQKRLPAFYNHSRPHLQHSGSALHLNQVRGMPPKSEAFLDMHLQPDYKGGEISPNDSPRVDHAIKSGQSSFFTPRLAVEKS